MKTISLSKITFFLEYEGSTCMYVLLPSYNVRVLRRRGPNEALYSVEIEPRGGRASVTDPGGPRRPVAHLPGVIRTTAGGPRRSGPCSRESSSSMIEPSRRNDDAGPRPTKNALAPAACGMPATRGTCRQGVAHPARAAGLGLAERGPSRPAPS